MEKEEWKVFKKTYSCRYSCHIKWEVSDQGNIKKNGIPYECRLNRGYKVFGPHWSVHKAVAMLFIPNPENKPEVDHINGDRLDNRSCNLRWCTHKQNCNNPITRKRVSEAAKNRPPINEETRKRRSESIKLYWKNKKLNK